jgi:hypothetical protein
VTRSPEETNWWRYRRCQTIPPGVGQGYSTAAVEGIKLLPREDSDYFKVLPHQDLETLSVRLLDEPSEGVLGLDLVALAEIKET